MKKKTNINRGIVFLILLFFIAVLPRALEFLSGNYVFGFDQGKHWMAAKAIVVDHKFPLIGDEVGGQGGFFQGSGWYYLLAVPFLVFGGDPYGAIALMLFLGVGTVILSYILFAPVFDKVTAFLIGLFLASSPVLISSSRLAWPPFVIPPLTVLYLFFVYKSIEKNYFFIPFVFFTVGMMVHFEIATASTLFAATCILFLFLVYERRIPLLRLLWGALFFFIPLFPLAVFDIRHNFLNFHGIMNTFFHGSRGITTMEMYMPIFSNHWTLFLSEFFGSFQMIYMPKILLGIGYVFGAVVLLRQKDMPMSNRIFIRYIFFLPICLFVVFLFYKNDLWPWWLFDISIAWSLFWGIMIGFFLRKKGIERLFAIVFLIATVASYITMNVNFYQKELHDYGGVHKMQGKKDALDVIYKDAEGKPFGLLVFTPPIYTYAYDYVISWYGKKQYGYVPPSEKKEIFYLLMETDYEKPWRHNGWLETVIKDGIKEKEWVLPSGFIIEKRTLSL